MLQWWGVAIVMDFKGMFFLFLYGYCPHPDQPTQIWINPYFFLNPSLRHGFYSESEKLMGNRVKHQPTLEHNNDGGEGVSWL